MSDLFKWSPAFSINVPEMDREHQVLIELMNSLNELWKKGAGRSELGKALADLVSYTRRHFADEEAYMLRIGYPDLTRHRMIHERLLSQLDDFAAEFRHSSKLSDDLFVFLKTWLKAHICGIDTKYAAHEQRAKVG